MPERPILTFEGLTKRYGAVTALDGVSAAIFPGELVSFVGPSGCGKTTLLRLLGGFLTPDAGRIWLDGSDITAEPPNRRATALVFQNYALFPHMSVAENIGYAARIRRRPSAEVNRRVGELLSLVRLDGLGHRRPDQLSGGQQQRVALARALCFNPRVLLLDEPLSNLDAHLRILMRAELKRLQRELALTVVYVTHDQEEALSISDRIAVMDAGRIQQVGLPREVYERPANEFVARFVGVANFVEGEMAGVTETGEMVVHSALGELRLHPAGDLPRPGAPVRLVIRPEAIRIAPQGEAGPNRVPARIETVLYTGSLIRYGMEAEGVSLTVDQPDPRHIVPHREGERVTLIFPPDAHFLPADAER
ncbi:MAG: ABC transporter ATP-binding protein [Armatimonadota bacterium]|nr:ABC transporter ATP-binding protein [Armatimonadota bacterium]